MDSIKFPEEDIERLLLFTGLQKGVKDQFLKELSAYKKGMMPIDFVEHLVRNSDLYYSEAQEIFGLVVSLITVKDTYNYDNERLYAELSEYLTVTEGFRDNALESVLKDLHDIIFNAGQDILFSLAALGAISDNSKQISNTRITHEIKPVFLKSGLEGFVLVHKLKIDYRENEQDKEMSFSLDSAEFEALKNAVKYAESTLIQIKEKSGFDF
jgi:hypothetical protein